MCRGTWRRRGIKAAAPDSQDENSSGVTLESQINRGSSNGWLFGPAIPDLQVVADSTPSSASHGRKLGCVLPLG